MSITVPWTEGETGPRPFLMLDGNGPIPLTGMTVSLRLVKASDEVTEVATTGDVSIIDAPNGVVQYAPAAEDLKAADSPLLARWWLTDAQGRTARLPEGEPDVWIIRRV